MTARRQELLPVRAELSKLRSLLHMVSAELETVERVVKILASREEIAEMESEGLLSEEEAYRLAARVRRGDLSLVAALQEVRHNRAGGDVNGKPKTH